MSNQEPGTHKKPPEPDNIASEIETGDKLTYKRQ